MAKNIRQFSDGAISTNFETEFYNAEFKQSEDGKTTQRWGVSVAWQNGGGTPNSNDKIILYGLVGDKPIKLKESAIDSTDNTADALLFNIDAPLNAVKVKLEIDGITSIELQIDYDVIRL